MPLDFVETLKTWRHHLHANPELSRQESATAAYVRAELTRLGVPHEGGIGGHGVVATIRRGPSNRSVGLRADMDALPILETTNLPYASKNSGVMHACGHDGHTASLLGAAKLPSKGRSSLVRHHSFRFPTRGRRFRRRPGDAERWPAHPFPDGAHFRLP
jgi:hippurate hydrolase